MHINTLGMSGQFCFCSFHFRSTTMPHTNANNCCMSECVILAGRRWGWAECTRLSLQVRRWGRLVQSGYGYWHSISMNENIFCVQKGMKATPPDVWTRLSQTNAGHQHSIKRSFHTEVKGRRHFVAVSDWKVIFCDCESLRLWKLTWSETCEQVPLGGNYILIYYRKGSR